MSIDGWTILLQAINFLILVWLLRRFLYRPVLAVIAAREAETTRTRAAAAEARTAAEAARQAVEVERATLAADRDRLTNEAVAAAEQQRAILLDKARGEAERLLNEARQRIANEREEALDALKARILDLGTGLSERLLRDIAAEATPLLFDRACAALDASASSGTGEGLTILLYAAVPIDESTLKDWTRRLSDTLGHPVSLSLRVEPDLVAGVELHFPTMVLTQSWRDALNRAREEMVRDEKSDAVA